jgi:C-terminal processing protease CtpA/Prc
MEREPVSEASGITREVLYLSNAGGAALIRRFIVLVDSNTASAAEILTAALMDNRSDIVMMGVNTRGKARGQVSGYTPAGGIAKITSMTLTTSQDLDYNDVGLPPDVMLDDSLDWLEEAYNRALLDLGISSKTLAGTRSHLKNLELNRMLMAPGNKSDFPLIVRKDIINEKTH